MARPTKKTPETIAKLKEALKAGVSRRHAAQYAGISYDILKEWCRTDDTFSTQLNASESEGVVGHAMFLSSHVGSDAFEPVALDAASVNASKFYLSTRKQDPWVTKQATEVTGNLTVAEVARQADAAAKLKQAMEESE